MAHNTIFILLTIFKYAFAMLFPVLILVQSPGRKETRRIFGFAVFQLVCVAAITDLATAFAGTIPGFLVSMVLVFIFNAQYLVLYFGGSFTSLIMLDNLDMLQDLGGKLVLYLFGVVLVLVFTALPVVSLPHSPAVTIVEMILAIALIVCAILPNTREVSPYYMLIGLIVEITRHLNFKKQIAKTPDCREEFYQEGLPFHREPAEGLSDHPNVILIFTEGFSENIIRDERNVTPNLRKTEGESIHFTDYFNHTYATYMGIIGQLFSGFQFSNYNENHLIGLADILRDRGYQSAMINTEPDNKNFSKYLASLGFDETITDRARVKKLGAGLTAMPDSAAYDFLLETVNRQAEKGKPFFTAIYTFQTHLSLNSEENRFGDGKSPSLNKYSNLDAQFGRFFEELRKSPAGRDTILVFTGDHCTYQDSDYINAFPDYNRESVILDRVPLFFWYEGVKPEEIDAGGRTSLNIAPTLLDLMHVSAPNYFLGHSLFGEPAEDGLDFAFQSLETWGETKGGSFRLSDKEEIRAFRELLTRYYASIS